MNSTCRLPFNFDPKPLQIDLENVKATDWVRHFNSDYFDGNWEGVALRSIGGVGNQIYPDPHSVGEVLDTDLLKRCPNITAAVRSFECEIRSARLLRLTPGSKIREHRDYNLGFSDGEVRLHVPIITNAYVQFYLNGRRVEMAEGECWYLDFSLPHKVANNGDVDRVHLVVDCKLNDWLRSQLSACEAATETLDLQAADKRGGWEEFRLFVLESPDVQAVLRETDDRRAFVDLVVAEGASSGFIFSAEEVEDDIHKARRTWFERWID